MQGIKQGKQVGEEEYKEMQYHKKNGVVFLEDDLDFFLLKVCQFSSKSGVSSIEMDNHIISLYAKEYNIDTLQLIEIIHQINWGVNERNTKST